MTNQTPKTPRKYLPAILSNLLDNPRIRRIEHEGQVWYAADDVVQLLSDSGRPAEPFEDLQQREPDLIRFSDRLELADGSGEVVEAVTLEGVLRLAQSLTTTPAQKLKLWLAAAGRRQLDEAADPAFHWVGLQKEYARQGYSNSWVQKRLRGMAARQELVREWSRRGVRASEDYRRLTNALFETAFGMDVASYRGVKDLRRTSENLRDHMNDLELTLTLLAETTAMTLHRSRGSNGVDELLADVQAAGRITRTARLEIDRSGAREAA